MNFYERLNVAADATGDTIKKNYRALARKHHPDKPEGDTAIMQEVQLAYSVLSDPDKRAHYDRTGEEMPPPQQDPVEAILSGLFIHLIAQAMEKDFNILAKAKEGLNSEIQSAKMQKASAKTHSTRLKKLLARVTCKDELNYFEMAATAQLGKAESIIEHADNVIFNSGKAIERLEDYADNFKKPREQSLAEHFNSSRFNDPYRTSRNPFSGGFNP